jgi:hypothetical protein
MLLMVIVVVMVWMVDGDHVMHVFPQTRVTILLRTAAIRLIRNGNRLQTTDGTTSITSK